MIVTGASGFIGSHLIKATSAEPFYHYNHTSPVGGDIRDFDSVFSAMENHDEIIHMAALIDIPYSYKTPMGYIQTNIVGTYNVLESARRLKYKRVTIISSSEVYGTAQYAPMDEKHPLNAQSPYAATKIGAEQLALSYSKSYDLPVVVVRPFNVYGPGQSERAIISSIIKQLLVGDTVYLGNINSERDFNYVDDTVAGVLSASGCAPGGVYNIGSGICYSIKDILKIVGGLLGKKKIKIEITQDRLRPDKSDVTKLLCDSAKLTNKSGWKSCWDITEGLKKTIEWFSCKR